MLPVVIKKSCTEIVHYGYVPLWINVVGHQTINLFHATVRGILMTTDKKSLEEAFAAGFDYGQMDLYTDTPSFEEWFDATYGGPDCE